MIIIDTIELAIALLFKLRLLLFKSHIYQENTKDLK